MFNTPRLSVSDGVIGGQDSNPTSVDHSRDQRSPHGIEGAGNGTSTHENQRRRSNHGAAGGRSILTDAGGRSRTDTTHNAPSQLRYESAARYKKREGYNITASRNVDVAT